MRRRLAAAALLLGACSGGGKATTPAQAPKDATHGPTAAATQTDAATARSERAPFDKSKLAPDIEPCVGHDGAYVHCVARVVTGNRPKSLAFSPDGKELWVALHYDKPALAVYDTTSFALIGAVELGKYGAVELAFSADGSRVYASQFETADVYEVDRAKRKLLRVLETGSAESKVIELSPDGRTLWVANWSGNEVTEFDLASGKRRRGLETPGIPRGLYATRDGKELWVAGFEPGRLWRFDLDTGARATIFDKGHSMRHLVADEDDERLYISDLGDAKVWVANMLTGETKVLAEVNPKPNTIDLTPDGKVLYVSCRGTNNPETYLNVGPEWGTVLALDAHTGRKLDAVITGNQSTGLDVSPDGRLLATSDFLDNRINVYELPATATLRGGDGGTSSTYRANVTKKGDWGHKTPRDPHLWDKLPSPPAPANGKDQGEKK